MSLAIMAVPIVVQLRKQRNPAMALAARYAANAVVVQARPKPAPVATDGDTAAGEAAPTQATSEGASA